jgi:hypothetical protein
MRRDWLRTLWKRRETRLDALDHCLDRVAIRCVNEVMLATACGFVLRSVGRGSAPITNELRKSVSATAQLLDQIEHFARLPTTTEATRH